MKNSVKLFFSVVGSFLSSVLGVLYVPVLLMVLCNVIDYITGLMAAAYRNDGISSYKSMRGIAKKISMWLLVVVGAIIDQVLIYTCDMFGYTWPIPFAVAAVVAVWIICNEIISILENFIDIGITIPKFLLPLVKHIQSVTENTANIENDKDEVNTNE